MSIQKEFKPLLAGKINQLYHQGFTVLHRYELLGWFGNERLTHAIWVEIQEEWEECLEDDDDDHMLKVIEDDEEEKKTQTFLIVDSYRLNKISLYTKKGGK